MRKTASGKMKRTFTVVDAKHVDGCATKFHGGSYTGSGPAQAASKAFTQLCKVKTVKGQCSLIITMRETTQEAKTKKEFKYKATRSKLAVPVVLGSRVLEYVNKVHATKGSPTCKKSRKSSGPMRRSRKSSKKSSKKSTKKSSKK